MDNTIYTLSNHNDIYIVECKEENDSIVYRCKIFDKRIPDESTRLALRFKELYKDRDILDIGTGTGILLLELYKKYHIQECIGVEINRQRYSLAVQNMKNNGIDEKVKLFCGDYRELDAYYLTNVANIICNPPLIPGEEGFWTELDKKASIPMYEYLLHWAKKKIYKPQNGISILLHVFDYIGVKQRTGDIPSLIELAEMEGYHLRVLENFQKSVTSKSSIFTKRRQIAEHYPDGRISIENQSFTILEFSTMGSIKSSKVLLPCSIVEFFCN